jgi:hypothetical protein
VHESDTIKDDVLTKIANGRPVVRIPRAKARIGSSVIHIRFRSNGKSGGIWSFNINPNTLTVDFELLICGSSEIYYLIPISEIREIYQDPRAYPDRQHPEIRVIDVNVLTHRYTYGSGLQKDMTAYFRAMRG